MRAHGRAAAILVATLSLSTCAEAPRSASQGTAVDSAGAPPASAAYLAMLPDGEVKRRFLLDCTNCHTFDDAIAFPADTPRTRESWSEATERMLGYAGASTAFPVMGPGRQAGATADWLLRHAARPTRPSPARRLPDGATVHEFLLPEEADLPHDVAVLPDGRVLATGMFTHQMWILDPVSGSWGTEAIPVPDANPRAVVVRTPPGRDGSEPDWWVLLGAPNRLAWRSGATGEWTSWDIGVYGHSVALDADGRAWFNSHFTTSPGVIGFVDPATGAVVTHEVPTPPGIADGGTPIPYGLRVAPDGSVWGTELRGNRIVRLDPLTGDVRAWEMPLEVSGPRRPDFDTRGALWIPEYAGNALTRFDPETETFRRHPLPIRDALPYVVRVDRRRDRIWVGTGAADAVLSFDPGEERFTTYPLPSRGALIRHMDVDQESGDVWLAYGASPGIPARIARLRPPASPLRGARR